MGHRNGFSLAEAIASLALVALVGAVAIPATLELRSSAATAAGARTVASTLFAMRWQSTSRGLAHGLLFDLDARGWYWLRVRDGNGNGLRTAEVLAGIDPTDSGPHRLEDSVPRVRFGFPPGSSFPRIPPAKGNLTNLTDPIRIGNTQLLVFSPQGTSTSGTLYLTDGARLYGVVTYGRTGRIRVWRFDAGENRWKA